MLTLASSSEFEPGRKKRARAGSLLTSKMRERGYVRVAEVAKRTDVHRTTVYRWIRDGVVQAIDFQGAYYVLWGSVVEHLGQVAQILGLTSAATESTTNETPDDEGE